jgi:hypothetical protein
MLLITMISLVQLSYVLATDAWFAKPDDELRRLALPWFQQMRGCGSDVRELLHIRLRLRPLAYGARGRATRFVCAGIRHQLNPCSRREQISATRSTVTPRRCSTASGCSVGSSSM